MFPSYVLTYDRIRHFANEMKRSFGNALNKENQHLDEETCTKIARDFNSFTSLETEKAADIRQKLDSIIAILQPYSSHMSSVPYLINLFAALKDRAEYEVKEHPFHDPQRVANIIKTYLGPKGMSKNIQAADSEVKIFKNGTTLIEENSNSNYVTTMLVELSKTQDMEVGDGTSSVVVMAGALLNAAQGLLDDELDPKTISKSFQLAADDAIKALDKMSTPVDMENDEELIKLASASLNSKVVSQHSWLLAPMAVKAVKRIIDLESPDNVNLNMIKLVKKLGETVEESELIDGALIEQKSMGHGGPSRIEKAKIGLIKFLGDNEDTCLTALQAFVEKTGCNVLLLQKSILRDAVTEKALHFFAKMKIMVVKDIEYEDIEFYSKILGCRPVSSVDQFVPEALGTADLVEESSDEAVIKVTGLQNPGQAVSILLRGSNKLVLDSLSSVLMRLIKVISCLVKKRALLPGGGAPEMEVAVKLRQGASTKQGAEQYCWEAYAGAMESIPYTLAKNAGLDPDETVLELRRQHANGNKVLGINFHKGAVTNIKEENVLQPLLVTSNAIKQASEMVSTMLKEDFILSAIR